MQQNNMLKGKQMFTYQDSGIPLSTRKDEATVILYCLGNTGTLLI